MPLDSSIALQGIQPKQFSPMQSVGQLMQLRGQMSENVLRQAQAEKAQAEVRGAQLKQQEEQRIQGEQKTFQSTLAGNGGDWNKTFDQLTKAGTVSPTTIDAIRNKHAEAVKNVSLQDEQDIKLHNQRLDQLGAGVAGVLQLAPEAQAEAFSNFRARSLADPQLGEDARKMPEQWDPGWAKQAQWMGASTKQVNDAALALKEEDRKAAGERRAVELFTQTLAEKKADTTLKQLEVTGQKPIQPADQARILNDQTTRTETARHNRVEEGIAGAREGREARALDLKTKGALGQLNPAQSALSKKVADGDLSVEQLSRLPDKEAIIAGALEMNPDWTRNTFATKKAFSDPASKQSQNLGTISRIVGHIGRFEKNSEELGVSPSMLTGVTLTGTAGAVNNDAHAIAGELEKLVSGGVGTVGQIHEWQKELKSSRPGIRKAAIDEISQLIGSQYEGMQQTYKAGTGQELPIDKYVSPEGRKWMAAKGIAGVKPEAAAAHKKGDVVSIGGKKVRITEIYSDGTFNGDEVKP